MDIHRPHGSWRALFFVFALSGLKPFAVFAEKEPFSPVFEEKITCDPPSALTASNVSETSASLFWASVAGASSYQIEWRAVGQTAWQTASSTFSGYQLNGLAACTDYEFRAQTTCSDGTMSAFSPETAFSTLCNPCDPPAGLSVANVTQTGAVLFWSAVGAALSYEVRLRPVGTTDWLDFASSTVGLPVSSLAPCTAHEFQVRSVCSGQTSAWSSPFEFTTLCPTCEPPVNVGVFNQTASSAALLWAAAQGAASYTVELKLATASVWETFPTSSNGLQANDLTPCATYHFRIKTVCGDSESAFSPIDSFSMQCVSPICEGPQNVAASAVSEEKIQVSWQPVAGANNYSIQYRLAGTAAWQLALSAGDLIELTGLTACDTYQIRIQTNCPQGPSGFSAPVSVATICPPCGEPTGLLAASASESSLGIVWASSANAEAYAFDYRKVGETDWTTLDVPQNSIVLQNLTACDTFEMQVRALCHNQMSAASPVLTASTSCPSGVFGFEKMETASLAIWPNPSRDGVFFIDPNGFEGPVEALVVRDAFGRAVDFGWRASSPSVVSIDGAAASGTYFFEARWAAKRAFGRAVLLR